MLFIRKPLHVDAKGLQTVLSVLFKTNNIGCITKITAQICSVEQHPLNYVLNLTITLL